MKPQRLPRELTRTINRAAHRLAADHERDLVRELRQQAAALLAQGITPAEVAHRLDLD